MRRTSGWMTTAWLCVALAAGPAEARDAARDLRRMIGYTILESASVRSVSDGSAGDKILVLDNGRVFQVQMLYLDPLPLTDVIIFGKKWKGSDSVAIKLLIDNEAYDAIPLK